MEYKIGDKVIFKDRYRIEEILKETLLLRNIDTNTKIWADMTEVIPYTEPVPLNELQQAFNHIYEWNRDNGASWHYTYSHLYIPPIPIPEKGTPIEVFINDVYYIVYSSGVYENGVLKAYREKNLYDKYNGYLEAKTWRVL